MQAVLGVRTSDAVSHAVPGQVEQHAAAWVPCFFTGLEAWLCGRGHQQIVHYTLSSVLWPCVVCRARSKACGCSAKEPPARQLGEDVGRHCGLAAFYLGHVRSEPHGRPAHGSAVPPRPRANALPWSPAPTNTPRQTWCGVGACSLFPCVRAWAASVAESGCQGLCTSCFHRCGVPGSTRGSSLSELARGAGRKAAGRCQERGACGRARHPQGRGAYKRVLPRARG